MDVQKRTIVDSFKVIVPGKIRAWQRTRQNYKTGAYFPSQQDEDTRSWIVTCWTQCGRPTLYCNYYGLMVTAAFKRPASHFRTNGELNKQGLAKPYPSRLDLDNVTKLIDVFVKIGAVPDDRYAVTQVANSIWSGDGDEHLTFFFARRG